MKIFMDDSIQLKVQGAAVNMCHAMGLPDSQTNVRQCMVMLASLKKFGERNAEYKDLWKEAGLDDNAHHAKSKAMRLQRAAHDMNGPFCADDPGAPERTMEQVEAEHEVQIWDRATDDALDLIGYACFSARQVIETDPRLGNDADPVAW